LSNAEEQRRERLIQLAEDIRPAWTLTMADLQLLEFVTEWDNFWGDGPASFRPIGTMHEAAAALHNIDPKHLRGATLRDWVGSFVTDLTNLRDTMDSIARASATNKEVYQQGRMTRDFLKAMDYGHVAVQLARVERNGEAKYAMKRGNQLLTEQPIGTQIRFFVDFGGMKELKCYHVESALAANMWASEAKLQSNRYIDRQHATVAMPYCDIFVTDDRDLIKRCGAAKMEVSFKTAEIHRGELFINWLSAQMP
jgi:hypothetical protein